MVIQSHLSVLEQAANLYPSRPVFKLPKLTAGSEEVEEWTSITYSQFHADVEKYAKFWTRVLTDNGLEPRSVVALWLGGLTYTDVLHIYGIARAGYIPQLFSLRLPNPDIVAELLRKANAKALIYDLSYVSAASTFTVPVHPATYIERPDVEDVALYNHLAPEGADIAMIFHTSGSTSGSPKLVRCTYKWLDAIVSKAYYTGLPKDKSTPDVTVWLGSMCHIGQTFTLIGSLQHGTCTIQPTKIAFSSDELADMIARCGLNRLEQFATFFSAHVKRARNDPKLLGLLQGLDQIVYSGLTLASEHDAFALEKGLNVRNLFGSTECGAMMLAVGGSGPDARHLRPIEGTSYGFWPLESNKAAEGEHVNANGQLLELVILSDSGDCPDPALRSTDGHYHTGDLFQEVSPGSYIFRGRDDDWIKSENSLRCDTKAIEDNVRATCAELVAECIVVGNGRPSPALFVESRAGMRDEALKKAILRRIRHFHARRYLHEQITSATLIFVVKEGTLPRTATKGNIRRRAVEEQFKAELDAAYGVRD